MYCFTHWAEAEDHEADDSCSDMLDVGNQNRTAIGPMPPYAFAMAVAAAQHRERRRLTLGRTEHRPHRHPQT
jgi:hypothetical protein